MKTFILVNWILLSLSNLPQFVSAQKDADGWTTVWWDPMAILFHLPESPFGFWNVIKTTTTPNEGTNEKQYYTGDKKNLNMHSVFLDDNGNGELRLIPIKDENGWTSARLESKDSIACPDGKMLRLEASIRVPNADSAKQAGFWPAFWAMGESYKKGIVWPMCGEWDVMETVQGNGYALGTLHAGVNGERKSFPMKPNEERQKEFNNNDVIVWGIELNRGPSDWREQSFSWFKNSEKWQEVKGSDINDENIWKQLTQQAYFAILNVAVGHNIGGEHNPDDQTASGFENGAAMIVNYVKFKIKDA